MITISGILGVGLYVRSGSILRIGGPGAVLISFAILGLLAWLVMQCIAEMLCIWPISGALVEFVRTFVDEDLAITVGAAYWFTYSIAFSALISATAGEADFWDPGKPILGVVIFFIIPLLLIIFNSFGVEIYGFTEVVGGFTKLAFAFIIIICMIAINVGAGPGEAIGTKMYRGNIFNHDKDVADNWTVAFFICLSIAAFAFVGVEITAATALEARARPQPGGHGPASISVKFSATWTAFIAAVIYFLGGLLMSLNVRWDDPGLPRASWLGSPINATASNTTSGQSNSGFVLAAKQSRIPGLDSAFTVFLLITALTAANTNLYVASRTLFGLTRELQYGRWWSPTTWLAFFGRTNNYKVPVRAMFLSCCLLWVPFLYLSPHNTPGTAIATLLEVLSEMGSVGCVMVWACECWAFIRFYRCVWRHRAEFRADDRFAHVRRFDFVDDDDRYPWRGHGQPFTMVLALAGCLFVLVIANGAALWKGFNKTPFLSAYLAPLFFGAFWVCLKVYRYGGWRNVEWALADLDDVDEVKRKIMRLDDIRFRATGDENDVGPRGWGNLWGLW